ncbi:response regulator receiver:LytTr DNA-binding region [gamma proteobacterium HTCC5015]|nr:response regulator receiver:LytTr DNA-binding region [gamma proteobacterium HTCC5015]
MAISVLIVDDEPPARQRLVRLVEKTPGYEVVAEAGNGIDAIARFNETQAQIVLLDIRMPVMDGIEAAQHLTQHETPPAIIFTTAYSDHALQAFESHAIDYLLKPIRQERLDQALEAAQRSNLAQVKSVAEDSDSDSRQHICVRNRGNLELVDIDDIFYFFAEHKYVTLRHRGGEVLIEEALIGLEKEFGDRFLRIHRNCLIAVEQLQGLEKNADGTHRVVLKNCEDRLEVSRRHLSTVRKLLRGKT